MTALTKLKRCRGAYLALGRKNFKETNFNLFEECFKMSQRSHYVSTGNRLEKIHKNFI